MSTDTRFAADPIKAKASKSRTYGVRFALCMLAASLVLAGCGGGGEDSSAANNTGGSTGGGSTGGGSTGGGGTGGGSGGGGSPPPVTGSATLTWQPPTQKTDGTPLNVNDLKGYKIYWGQSQGSPTNAVVVNDNGISSYVVTQLGQGTWYFVVTAIDINDVESTFSNVASKTI